MRATLALLLLACDPGAGTGTGTGTNPAPEPEARKPAPEVRNPDPTRLPDLNLTTIDSFPLSTADLRGKVTLLLVWASWCEPCTQEGPSLNDVYFRRKADINLVGISKDEADAPTMRAFRDRHHIRYPIVMATPELLRALGDPPEIPTFLLYGKDGKLRWTMSGSLPAPILERELDAALTGS